MLSSPKRGGKRLPKRPRLRQRLCRRARKSQAKKPSSLRQTTNGFSKHSCLQSLWSGLRLRYCSCARRRTISILSSLHRFERKRKKAARFTITMNRSRAARFISFRLLFFFRFRLFRFLFRFDFFRFRGFFGSFGAVFLFLLRLFLHRNRQIEHGLLQHAELDQ